MHLVWREAFRSASMELRSEISALRTLQSFLSRSKLVDLVAFREQGERW